MYADGQAARASGDVITCERPLPAFIQTAMRVQSERVRRYDRSGPKDLLNYRVQASSHGSAVSAIALHNLRDSKKIYACYRAIHGLLKPGGLFLNCDRFVDGVDPHLAALREAGFARLECPWQDPPRAILVAARAS